MKQLDAAGLRSPACSPLRPLSVLRARAVARIELEARFLARPLLRDFLHSPWRLIVSGQQLQERHRIECLWTEDSRTLPVSVGYQLKSDDGVHSRLPHNRLCTVLRHGPLVIDDMVEVCRAPLPVLALTPDPQTCAGFPLHSRPKRGRIR